ncbi:hypothetical protein HPB49_020150 [Dermacentor silvarum]|uniref:Uncharacterized protein n=1 Tax=Dermacentor silvarum TaxID=543639 RepID=A0ACB8D889_DERSI|nr:hypothetical protein HPB49_020150 [Dermacentor silvarum]
MSSRKEWRVCGERERDAVANALRQAGLTADTKAYTQQVLDASGKLPTGVFQGSHMDAGAFDECLETVVRHGHRGVVSRGQYCNLLVYAENGTAMRDGVASLSEYLHPKYRMSSSENEGHVRSKIMAVSSFILLSGICCGIGTWVVATSDVLPFIIFPGPLLNVATNTVDQYYVRPYYHAVCYFSGCIAFLAMEGFKNKKMTKGMQITGWCLSVGCGLASVFAKLPWYKSINPTAESVALVASFFDRILWSVFLVWITLACSSGRGGFVSRFLSWNAFVPLSKLTFGVYLIHFPFVHLMLHASRERILWSHFNVITLWFATLVWSFLLAYIAFLACDAPSTTLCRLIFGRLIGKPQTEPAEKDATGKKIPECRISSCA